MTRPIRYVNRGAEPLSFDGKTEAGGLVTYFRVHGYWTSPKELSGEVDLVLGCGRRRSQSTATHA
jgi:hypothetical protein